jgi:heme exporter protein C
MAFYLAPVASAPLFFNQKIFYYHVPVAFMLFAGVISCGVASILYLRKRDARWDDVAHAGAAVAMVFGAAMLVSGSLWAKPAWGAWWSWDARMTSALLLEMTMIGYILVRKYGGAGNERLAAGLGIFGMVNIPLVYISATLWNTQHPSAKTVPTLQPLMRIAFWSSVLLFLLVFILIFRLRTNLGRSARRLGELRERALDAGLFE